MVSEYRALRASVVRLWTNQEADTVAEPESVELTRFNEAIDQALTESLNFYSAARESSWNLLLGILGHDLLNPIGSARMSAQLTLNLGPLTDRQTMLQTQIVESASRATDIIVSLIDFTRARGGAGLPIIKEPMDMGLVGRQLVDEMRVLYPARAFAIDLSGDLEGEWDKPRIGQVFSNLLSNAAKYGFTDSTITVKVEGGPEDVTLSVHNDGVPILSTDVGIVFDSFSRGKSDEKAEDHPNSMHLGLGLYIVKEIVSAHGGTIEVTSSEKDGTYFFARFPR